MVEVWKRQGHTAKGTVNDYTAKQWETLRGLLLELKSKYPNVNIVGHCDYEPNKTCPNFNVKQWAKENNFI